MNRALLFLISLSGVSSLMLMDSAIKGAALLLFAAGVALFLRRDSSATRHMVWLEAIIALLAMPDLSAMLPQWRALPNWVSVVEVSEQNRDGSDGKNGIYDVEPRIPNSPDSHTSHDFDPAEALPFDDALQSIPIDDVATATTFEPTVTAAIPAAAAANPIIWIWQHVMTSLWFVGFAMLIIRLAIARVLLWRTERQSRSCQSRRHSPSDESNSSAEAIRTAAQTLADHAKTAFHHSESDVYSAFTAACSTLNIGQHITLLLHPDKTIPVVWGIFRPRLMLPLAAKNWSSEQLQSVLLHELAHIKRRDVLGQLLAQFACTLHWFNPLVWLAAWRMHVERERACDDLVLASGVRPSAYAEHLLNVATRLSSSPWTQACGLAMAWNSSLHGRLIAVLSEKQNRRRVSSTVLAAAMMICTAVVVPVAMLCAADETPSDTADRLQSGKIDFEPTTKSEDNNETLNFRSNMIAAGAFAIDEEESAPNVATSSTSEENKKKPSQVEVDFAKVRLAKAKVDLEQRLDANKEYPSFTPVEIRQTELEVEAADAMLRMLDKVDEISKKARIDLADIKLQKLKLEMIKGTDDLNSRMEKARDRLESTIENADARLAAANAINQPLEVQSVQDKLHIANRSGTFDLGKGRTLKIDESGIDEQWFEIQWPANGEWKASRLRIPVSMSEAVVAMLRMQPQTRVRNDGHDQGKSDDTKPESRMEIVEPTINWKVVWEENTNDVWFENGQWAAVVTRLNIANPAEITATHYDRGDISKDQEVPERIRLRYPAPDRRILNALFGGPAQRRNEAEPQLKLAAESSAD